MIVLLDFAVGRGTVTLGREFADRQRVSPRIPPLSPNGETGIGVRRRAGNGKAGGQQHGQDPFT
jgi:hypothetical protein